MTDSPSETPEVPGDATDGADASATAGSAPGAEDQMAVADEADLPDPPRDEKAGVEEESQFEGDEAEVPAEEQSETAALAARIAELVGAESWSADYATAKVKVTAESWKSAVESLKASGDFPFFSWLSAIDWAAEPTVGEPVADPESLNERIEILCRVSSLSDDSAVTLSADLPRDGAVIDTVSGVYGGADWHERETHEMFGVEFTGHPNLAKLYLPDAFEGFPLRKDYPLLSREVKPWPGTVDVEGMPSTENEEAEAMATDGGDE